MTDQIPDKTVFKGEGLFYFVDSSAVHHGEEDLAEEVPWSLVANQEAEKGKWNGQLTFIFSFSFLIHPRP